jgi:Ca2+/Na+ antiporter
MIETILREIVLSATVTCICLGGISYSIAQGRKKLSRIGIALTISPCIVYLIFLMSIK